MIRIFSALLFCLYSLPAGAVSAAFGGVGIDGVPLGAGGIRVSQIVSGGPAHRAGIRTGDVITHIDGKSVSGEEFRSLVLKRLRGRAGTPVVLTVRRGGDGSLTFRLVRRQIMLSP